MMMEFTPALVACVISSANHSHRMIRNSDECVINLPTTKLTKEVIAIGNSSGSEIHKFREFGLTADEADKVEAPLIRECHASFECRLHDDVLIDKYDLWIPVRQRRIGLKIRKHSRTPERKKPDPIDIHVDRRIRMWRVWIDMAQATLAAALGITFQQMQKYEKNR